MFPLARHEVHVWCANLDAPADTSACFYATLSPEERSRSERFQFPRDRQHFTTAHGVLRELLGRYLETRPEQVRFVYNPFGKPGLGPEFGGRIQFNLSHSAGLALIAIAADANVGVDLECIRAQPDYEDIAQHFFSAAEAEQLGTFPKPLYPEAFIACWTRKEAYLKACGRGLSMPLDGFSVPLTTDPEQNPVDLDVASNDSDQVKHWSLYTLQPAPGYLGALVIEGGGWHLRRWQWEGHQASRLG